MDKFTKGDDWLEGDADYHTYAINHGEHGAKIQVFGDEALRDRILLFLQSDVELTRD